MKKDDGKIRVYARDDRREEKNMATECEDTEAASTYLSYMTTVNVLPFSDDEA